MLFWSIVVFGTILQVLEQFLNRKVSKFEQKNTLGSLGEPFGPSPAPLGILSGLKGSLGDPFGPSKAPLGSLSDPFGLPWGGFGGPWATLGVTLDGLGGSLGDPWDHFWRPGGQNGSQK